MFARLAEASTSLDIGTLFVIATCVTTLLGLFLLFAWMQDRVQALAWWGLAYLIGGFSGVLWQLGGALSPWVPSWTADVLLFIAVGMIWSAAPRRRRRRPLRINLCLGHARRRRRIDAVHLLHPEYRDGSYHAETGRDGALPLRRTTTAPGDSRTGRHAGYQLQSDDNAAALSRYRRYAHGVRGNRGRLSGGTELVPSPS